MTEVSTHPLSFAQERLWFIDRFEPVGSLYNIHRAFRVHGRLDRGALRAALDAVVARHAALRTNFGEVDGRPVQIVGPVSPADFQAIDLSTGPDGTTDMDAQGILLAEASRPFDLGHDRLFRAALITREDDAFLLLTMHHIVSDGWSLSVLSEELTELYAAALSGRSPRLPPLPIQYVDYARGQRDWLQGEKLQELAGYWERALAGTPPVLDLPTDRPRPARQSYRGTSRQFVLPADLTNALRELARQERSTLFMTALAALHALLYRYSSQTDIAIGTPIANRTRLDTEGLIGFFANTLVLRGQLSEEMSFRQLLQQVRATALEAYVHQDMPFEKLVEVLRPERNLSHPPLFQVLLAFQNVPRHALELEGARLEMIHLPQSTSKFDFHVSLSENGDRLDGHWEYNTDLFDAATADRMCRHLEVLLRGVVADPDRAVSAVPLLEPDERDRILLEWNRTTSSYPRDQSVQEVFEAQAAALPAAVALVQGDRRMGYEELNRRSNRLAHHLRHLGVGRDDVVGIAAERSIETVVSLLGILKAGGAYLPLDPSYPDERLRFMVKDAGARFVLARKDSPSGAVRWDARVIDLDAGEALANWSGENPSHQTAATDLAYVMYTSGSTGVPKGVAVPHRAVNRLVINTGYVQVRPEDSVAHVSNLSFDAATFEIWGALLNGARLVVVPDDDVLSPRTFADLLDRYGIDVMFLTVALFNQMAQEAPHAFRRVRDLLIGGELPDPHWVRAVMKAGRPKRVLNAYGPTETTTFACCHEIPDIPDGDTRSIPIGGPIANTRAYIVDARNQLVPVGIRGELLIGGDGLAREYLGRADLTNEKFIRDPFAADSGARAYRSGDLVRYRTDGAIEFLGRADQQVKLRGFRIELGEIESVLEGHAAVEDAVVLLHEAPGGEKRLVAYVQSSDRAITKPALRRFLETKVPAYEVPSDIAILDTFPRTPNGKIDRQALRLHAPAADSSGMHVAPRDRIERELAEIWGSVLTLESVGVHDDFFERGGHSLAAVRVFSRIEAVFGRRLPITSLFESPTIEALAARIREELAPARRSSVVEIQRGNAPLPMFFVHGIGGNVVGFRELARLLGPDRPVFGVQARGLFDDHPPDTNIETMAAHYVAEIRSRWPAGPYALGGLSFGGVVAFEMARQLTAAGARVALLAFLDAAALGSGRLLPRSAQYRRTISLLGRRIAHHVGTLTRLPPREKLTYTARRIRTIRRRTRSALWRAQFRLYSRFARLRADARGETLPERFRNVTEHLFLAARSYTPRHYSGSATLFRAQATPSIFLRDRSLGWSGLVDHLEIRDVPGDHATLLTEPHVRSLARELKQCLEDAEARL
jgi:amino acid adenylation domain-containing protein